MTYRILYPFHTNLVSIRSQLRLRANHAQNTKVFEQRRPSVHPNGEIGFAVGSSLASFSSTNIEGVVKVGLEGMNERCEEVRASFVEVSEGILWTVDGKIGVGGVVRVSGIAGPSRSPDSFVE